MEKFTKTPLGRFRFIALLEGISYLILVFICMPLKYFAGMEDAVKHIGWAHGVLFILYVLLLAQVFFTYRWSFMKGLWAFLASLVPFGTFILDKNLKKEQIA